MATTGGDLINGDNEIGNVPVGQGTKTFSISNLKAAQEDPLLMFKDHTRNSVRLFPIDNQVTIFPGRNMQFDFISKGFYHFLNWNRTIMQGFVKIKFPFTVAIQNENPTIEMVTPTNFDVGHIAGAEVSPQFTVYTQNSGILEDIVFSLPYSVSSLIQRYILKIGTVEVENINYYNHLIPYLENIQCKRINDGTTWRIPATVEYNVNSLPKISDMNTYAQQMQTIPLGGNITNVAQFNQATQNYQLDWKHYFKGLEDGYIPIQIDDISSRNIRIDNLITGDPIILTDPIVSIGNQANLPCGDLIDGIKGYVLYFPVQIPVFTCLEQGGWFPIYNMWNTISTQYTLTDFNNVFYFRNDDHQQIATPSYELYQPFMELETLTVKNDLALDMAPYTFKSVTWDIIPQQITFFSDKIKQWERTLEERYRNISGLLTWMEDESSNKSCIMDKIVNFVAENKTKKYNSPPLTTDPYCLIRIAGKNWPNENARDNLLLMYMSWCEFFNKYDDNGMIDSDFIDFDQWLEMGGFAADLSVLTQTPNIMSGVNVRRIPMHIAFKVSENSKLKANNTYTCYYAFVRNIILSFFQGTVQKQE